MDDEKMGDAASGDLEHSLLGRPASPTPADDAKSAAKQRHNSWFKMLGALALVLGTAGFAPSIYHFFAGELWSPALRSPALRTPTCRS